MTLTPVLVVGPLYAGSERGLAADILAARGLGLAPLPICTQLVVASQGVVTDVTDVPVDTVLAQLEHTLARGSARGAKIGGLARAETAEAVLDSLETFEGPIVLDLVASGSSGETVLDADGIAAVVPRLGVADLVTISRADAELVTGGSIESLDDAQVAAQRLCHRGAQRVVIRCGHLPYRFYDPADDPGGDGAAEALFFDLYYDGEDFTLFEAPLIRGEASEGASNVFAITALAGWIDGSAPEISLQRSKRAATDAVRWSMPASSFPPRIRYPILSKESAS